MSGFICGLFTACLLIVLFIVWLLKKINSHTTLPM